MRIFPTLGVLIFLLGAFEIKSAWAARPSEVDDLLSEVDSEVRPVKKPRPEPPRPLPRRPRPEKSYSDVDDLLNDLEEPKSAWRKSYGFELLLLNFSGTTSFAEVLHHTVADVDLRHLGVRLGPTFTYENKRQALLVGASLLVLYSSAYRAASSSLGAGVEGSTLTPGVEMNAGFLYKLNSIFGIGAALGLSFIYPLWPVNPAGTFTSPSKFFPTYKFLGRYMLGPDFSLQLELGLSENFNKFYIATGMNF